MTYLTKRDLFALAALQSAHKLMGPLRPENGSICDQVSKFCYRMASSMLVESEVNGRQTDERVGVFVSVDGGHITTEACDASD